MNRLLTGLENYFFVFCLVWVHFTLRLRWRQLITFPYSVVFSGNTLT